LSILNIFKTNASRYASASAGHIVPDPSRCVQCGICSYNCPISIDVRAYAWSGESVKHKECLTCGECVARCPRGALRFKLTDLFDGDTK